MTRNRLRTVLETMAVKASIANICKAEGTYSQNFRECPFWSELKGMEQALKIFGIETVYSFNADTSRITGIEADGIYIEVV